MSRGRAGTDPRLVAAAGAAAAALFIALFRLRSLGPLDFWAWLAANVVIVVVLGVLIDRSYLRRLRDDLSSRILRKAAIGIASAAVLYAVFTVGRVVALRILPFAAADLGSIRALRAGVPLARVVILIGLIIGPGEEIFWRGFFQERAGASVGKAYGFVLTALLYTSVHLASGNVMLVLAAALCGVFWGGLYLRFRSPLLNVFSHTLWDLMIFVVLPF